MLKRDGWCRPGRVHPRIVGQHGPARPNLGKDGPRRVADKGEKRAVLALDCHLLIWGKLMTRAGEVLHFFGLVSCASCCVIVSSQNVACVAQEAVVKKMKFYERTEGDERARASAEVLHAESLSTSLNGSKATFGWTWK